MSVAQLFYPMAAVLDQAAERATRLAGASVRLFVDGDDPGFGVTLSELLARECDFDGYPPGGIAIPGWAGPTLGPGRGGSILAQAIQFVFAGGGAGVTNLVGGFFMTTADGVLYTVGEFPEAIPMQTAGAPIPLLLSVFLPSGL